jgi:hypothetical protein
MSKRSRRFTGVSCSYCGVRAAASDDHVPPKSVFLLPLPQDMITVPACTECNGGFSNADEEFRLYLSIFLKLDTPEKLEFWQSRAMKTAKHNTKLRNSVLERMNEIPVTTAGGLYLGEVGVTTWEAKRHDAMIERIARGLYYKHFGKCLGLSIEIDVTVKSQQPAAFNELLSTLFPKCTKVGSIGGIQFEYLFGRDEDCDTASAWFFSFHRTHLVAAITMPLIRPDALTGQHSVWPRAPNA